MTVATALKGKRAYGKNGVRLGRRWFGRGTACVLAAAILVMPGSLAMAEPGPETPGGLGVAVEAETIARLAVGSGPGAVGIEHPAEGDAWGPASFDVGSDGCLYVLDGVNQVIHVVAAHGDYERDIPFPQGVLCPVDIRATSCGLYLLDLPLQPAAVHLIDFDGSLIDSWEIPDACIEDCVTGLRVAESVGKGAEPTIWLTIQNAWEVPLVTAGQRNRVQRVPMQRNVDVVDIPDASRQDYAVGSGRDARRFAVSKDWDSWQTAWVTGYRSDVPTARMRITSEGRIGAAWFVDTDADGNAYVYAEEIGPDTTTAYVKVFDASGDPASLCRIPLERCETFPHNTVRVTDDGDVLALVPGANAVDVVRLNTQRQEADGLSCESLETTVPDASDRPASDGWTLSGFLGALFGPEEAQAIWDQIDGYERGMEYCYNSWYCNKYNYYPNGVNIRPRYITSYNRNWQSVPYCWGGWDLKSTFNYAMSVNKDAGDINTSTSGKQPSTAGTDCSGLVSRLWGLGYKRNTGTSYDYGLCSTAVSYYIGTPGNAGERLGDIYIKPNSHVMMVDYVTLGGARVFESTTSYSYDRVVHPIRAWSGLPGYYARRNVNWWK